MADVFVFVYGSLKRGFENHRQLEQAEFLGSRATAPGYALFDVGRYPALSRRGRGCVEGELYRVGPGLLRRLDLFEGCPDLYERRLIELADGTPAFAYLMGSERLRGFRVVPDGSWPLKAEAAAAFGDP